MSLLPTTTPHPAPPSWRERWRPPTRDARDTLFMLALILWTVAPHLLRVSPWVALICLAVLGWRVTLAWRQGPLPGRWSVVLVMGSAAILTWLSERTLLGKDAGVTLLVVLMALKTLELRARRDALVVFFLGFFLILTQFLYSQSIFTAAGMLVAVWGWLTALTLAHMPSGQPRLRDAGRRAARAALIGTPVMVVLFLLFPRMGPLWSLPNDSAKTGLSDRVELGQVAELAQDDSIALRLKFLGSTPRPDQMYFRGPVLSRYDGQQWRADPWLPESERIPTGRPNFERPAGDVPSYTYEATFEPLRIRWLPLLEFAVDPPAGAAVADLLIAPGDDSHQWRLTHPLGERLRLQASAWPDLRLGPKLSSTQYNEYTRLPSALHMATRAWARELRQQPRLSAGHDAEFVAALLQHIRRDGFSYTLNPGRYEGDTIDEFWLKRQAGFCEHYAAAFVVILRSVGIPARLVTGYQGTDPEPVDGFYVVRQSHAHAWAEYWLPERGWTRADPTAAVAPDRIFRSRQLQTASGLMINTLDAVSPGLTASLRRWAELVDNRWNQWVLGYGRQQQFKMLDFWGIHGSDWVDMLQVVTVLAASLALLGATWAWWDGRRRSPWTRLSEAVRAELARLGVSSAAHEGPATWAQRVTLQHGTSAHALSEHLLALERARYAPPSELGHRSTRTQGMPAPTWLPSFKKLAKPLRQSQSAR